MIEHVLVRKHPICIYVDEEGRLEAVDETTRSEYRDINCAECLRLEIAAAEQRTQVLRDLLTKVEAVP